MQLRGIHQRRRWRIVKGRDESSVSWAVQHKWLQNPDSLASIILSLRSRNHFRSNMPSTTWAALRDQYITPSLQPTVETQLIAPLSRAYEGPNQSQITFAGLSATLSNLESGAILDIENKLGLRSLLTAAEPRVRYNEALSQFEREKAVAQTAIITMGFNDIEAKWFSTRLDYVDQKT